MAKLLLAQALKKKKMSKRQFAKKLGIQYSAVFRYFREGYDPKLSVLESWANALDIKIKELYEE